MAGAITTQGASTYRNFDVDGVPASGDHEPVKAEIRALFALIDGELSTLVDGLLIGNAVAYATRSALYTDLAHPAGRLGVVYNDGTPAYNGVYVKSGSSGSGAWTITNLALPASFASDLSTVISGLAAEVVARQAADAAEAAARAAADASEQEERLAADAELENTKAEKATTFTGGGLLSGGGDLSANRVISLSEASDAEALAGTDATKAMTPRRVKAAVDAAAALKADKATTITPAGLLVRTAGDGSLGASQTLSVPKATVAESDPGARDDVALTPRSIAPRLAELAAAEDLQQGGTLEGDDGRDLSRAWVFGILGRGGRILAGLTDGLRWRASGFEAPPGGGYGAGEASIGASGSKFAWAIRGRSGKAITYITRSLRLVANRLGVPVGGDIRVGERVIDSRSSQFAFALVGRTGRPMLAFRRDGSPFMPGVTDVIAALEADSTALGYSQGINRPHNADIQPLTATRQMVLIDGQSLACSMEAWPALTTPAPRSDCYMMGQSVRPQDQGLPRWLPQGSSALTPLVATVEPLTDNAGRTPLSPAQQAALPPGDGSEGECCLVAATLQVAKGWEARSGGVARKWVAASAAVQGKAIEELSQGATPDLFNRAVDAMELHKSLGDAASESTALGALIWMQGEYNSLTSAELAGAVWDRSKDGYKAKLLDLRADISAQAQSILGQAKPPAVFVYQTGGQYARDDGNLAIGMAQWEASREQDGLWMVGPVYPVTDKGGHLNSNGARWYGAQVGKVMRRVLVDGLDWEPLSPLTISTSGKTITLSLHVPAPPIRFDTPYAGDVAQTLADRGFRVTDGAGDVTLTSVEIVGAATIVISCARAPDLTSGRLWAGGQGAQGMTMVRDSDETRSDAVYEYLAGSGMYPSANIPALVDQPYDLGNWLIAFHLPLNWSRL